MSLSFAALDESPPLICCGLSVTTAHLLPRFEGKAPDIENLLAKVRMEEYDKQSDDVKELWDVYVRWILPCTYGTGAFGFWTDLQIDVRNGKKVDFESAFNATDEALAMALMKKKQPILESTETNQVGAPKKEVNTTLSEVEYVMEYQKIKKERRETPDEIKEKWYKVFDGHVRHWVSKGSYQVTKMQSESIEGKDCPPAVGMEELAEISKNLDSRKVLHNHNNQHGEDYEDYPMDDEINQAIDEAMKEVHGGTELPPLKEIHITNTNCASI